MEAVLFFGVAVFVFRSFLRVHRRKVHRRAPSLETVARVAAFRDRNGAERPAHQPSLRQQTLTGRCWVLDGDTIVIEKVHVRLAGIDAPELDHPLGQKAKWALHALCKGQVVTVTLDGSVSYDRAVGTCHLPDGRDLSAEMVRAGLALDWVNYSGGRYRNLEPPDARRRLWRADARQRGLMIPSPAKD